MFVHAFMSAAFDHGTVYTTSDVRAAAIWLPPGVEPDEQALAELTQRTTKSKQRATMGRVIEKMASSHPKEPHWYLPLLGVDPMMQSRGLGEIVMRPALDRCDQTGVPAYLESANPRNVPFYERLGFRVTGEVQVDDTPPLVLMLRPPLPAP